MNRHSPFTVDSWVGGTRANGTPYSVNGWAVEMPQCQRIRQEFEPHQLLHDLFRKRKANKFYGYIYRVVLSYETHLPADVLYNMNEILNANENDLLTIVPHIDKPGYQYSVMFDGSIGMEPFGVAGGHKGVAFTFAGKHLVSFPSIPEGYGFSYALYYGTGL